MNNRQCDRRFNGVRVLLFAMLLVFWGALAASAAEPKLETLPVNPKYLEYWEKVKAGEQPGGLMPSPIDWSVLKKGAAVSRSSGIAALPAALPSAYDLVAEGVTPPVLNQKNWGTCWSFAAIEGIESGVLSADKTNGTKNYKDLSEMHLAYYAFVDEEPNKPAFTGNPSWVDEDGNPRNAIFDNGGTYETVIALLSRGTGPVLFSDAPYPELGSPEEWAKYNPPAPAKGPAQFRLKNAYYFLPKPEIIKAAIMKFGALSIAYGAYKENGANIYTPESLPANHAVLLVGWDDNYPKENFVPAGPENNGAWKIQNSWGTDVGADGFYWISYEDKTLFGAENGDTAILPAAFEMMPADVYDGIYFHDPLGMSSFITTTDDALTAANAFTAEREEKIVYVGFMTGQDDQDCEIQIYSDIPKGGSPSAGKAAFAAPVPCHVLDGGGYVSIELDNPVQIRKGERFAVAVTYKRPAGNGLLAVPIENKMVPSYEKAVLNPNESYYSLGNEWRDTYYETDLKGNVCVKAVHRVVAGVGDEQWGKRRM